MLSKSIYIISRFWLGFRFKSQGISGLRYLISEIEKCKIICLSATKLLKVLARSYFN